MLIAVFMLSVAACQKKPEEADPNSTVDNSSSIEESTSAASEPVSNTAIQTFNAKVKEVSGNHYVVEKLNSNQIDYNGETTGVLYQFNYSSSEFKVGDIIVVEYKAPVQEIYPNNIVNLVNVYLAK